HVPAGVPGGQHAVPVGVGAGVRGFAAVVVEEGDRRPPDARAVAARPSAGVAEGRRRTRPATRAWVGVRACPLVASAMSGRTVAAPLADARSPVTGLAEALDSSGTSTVGASS